MSRNNQTRRLDFAAIMLVLMFLAISISSTINFHQPKNVLLLISDDMNNWIGALGGPAKTPNIDQLAKNGVLFSNAYTVSPACNPSRTALMTGQRPETTGQDINEGNFRDLPGGKNRLTLPQYLQKFGYQTIAAGKIFHNARNQAIKPNQLSDDISWNRQWTGLIATDVPYGQKKLTDSEKWHKGTIKKYLGNTGMWGPIEQQTKATGDFKLSDYCANFLQKKHDRPFFLARGVHRPHLPHFAPQKYFDLYPPSEIALPEIPENDMDDVPEIARIGHSSAMVAIMKKFGEYKKAIQGYLASMSFADDCLGHILKALKKGPNENNTIVIFLSDHGFQLGHKNRWEKFTLWKQSTQVPLVIKVPGEQPSIANSNVSLLDIYPTVLELLKLPIPDFVEGRSLKQLIQNKNVTSNFPAIISSTPAGSYSIVSKNWNYIRYHDGSEELYDHKTDPNEFHNLANDLNYLKIKKSIALNRPKKISPYLQSKILRNVAAQSSSAVHK